MRRGISDQELGPKDEYDDSTKVMKRYLREVFGRGHGLKLSGFVEAFRHDNQIRLSIRLHNRGCEIDEASKPTEDGKCK